MEVSGFVKARVTAVKLSKEKVQTEIEKARKELELATKALEKGKEVEAMIGEEEKLLEKALQEYLNSDVAKRKLSDWTKNAPEMSKVEKDGPVLIGARLQDVLLEWGMTEDGPVDQASIKITRMCMDMQAEIDSNIDELNNLELGFSLLKSSELCFGKGNVIYYIKYHILGIVATVLRVIGPRSLYTFVQKKAAEEENRSSIKCMTRMTEASMSTFLSNNGVHKFITESFTCLHRKWLTNFKMRSQCTIDSANGTIQKMEEDIHMRKDTIQMLKPLQTKLNERSKCLQELERDI